MPKEKTDAELALQRKYELLRQKKRKATKKSKDAASGSKSRDQDDDQAQKIDPVRQAAIEALKRKRAAGGGAPAATAPPTAAPPAAPKAEPNKPAPTSIKLKFVIPKKNLPASGTAKPAPIPLSKEKLGGAPIPKPKANTATAAASPAATEGQQTAKRPAIRRTVPQRPALQEQPGQPQSTTPAAAEGEGAEAGPAAPVPGAVTASGTIIPSIPRLFVGDLPEHFTSDTLYNFFSEFHQVEEAHVVRSNCYGFVTFGSYEDAQAVLDFQSQQPIQVEDRYLRISWAKDITPFATLRSREYAYTAGGNGDGAPLEHPRMQAARLAAAQVIEQQDQHALEDVHYNEAPGRNLVCYDDL